MKTHPIQEPARPFALLGRAARALFHTLFGAAPNEQLWARMVTDPVATRRPVTCPIPRRRPTPLKRRRHIAPTETPPPRAHRRRRRRRAHHPPARRL